MNIIFYRAESSTLLNPTIQGVWFWNGEAFALLFLIIIAISEAIINTIAHDITIPAMAPPDNLKILYKLYFY